MDRRLSNAAPGCVGFYPLMLLSSQLLKGEQIGGLLVADLASSAACTLGYSEEESLLLFIPLLMSEMC